MLFFYLTSVQNFPYPCTQTRRLERRGFLISLFFFSVVHAWMHCTFVQFFLSCAILRGCTEGLAQEVLVTRARKGTSFQATKYLRVESPVLNEIVSMEGYSSGYSKEAATVLSIILGFPHPYLWGRAISPSGICLHNVL